MVVGMHGRIMAQGVAKHLAGAVCQDLVHVHIGAGARTALNVVDDELVGQPTSHDLFTGPDDGSGLLGVEASSRAVGNGGGLLHQGKVADKHRVHGLTRDGEVTLRAQGLHAVVGINRNVHLANGVLLATSGLYACLGIHRGGRHGRLGALNILAHNVSF